MEDVTSLTINARKPEHIIELNPEERKVLRTWLATDESTVIFQPYLIKELLNLVHPVWMKKF